MTLTKGNYSQVKEILTTSLQKYIDYVNEYCCDHEDWFNDWENIAHKPLEELGITKDDVKEILDHYRDWQYKRIAMDLLNHLDDIHAKVIEIFVDPPIDPQYPKRVREWLYDFRFFCYGDDVNGKFLSLEEQNVMVSKYPHFDVSYKKKIKKLGDYA